MNRTSEINIASFLMHQFTCVKPDKNWFSNVLIKVINNFYLAEIK